ncbi:MAG: DUF2599 domain-containing protein [Breznakia sp.]
MHYEKVNKFIFSTVTWIKRSGKVSLSVTPKHPRAVNKSASWNQLYLYFQYHPFYTQVQNQSRQSSLYNQYICHVDFAKDRKVPWNLEPWRRDKGYWGFVFNRCN